MKVSLRIIATVFAASLACGTAQAALFGDDEARQAILDLRKQIEGSEKLRTDDSAQLRRSLLDLQNLIEAMRAELAVLRGRNEQLARDMAEMQRQQKDLSQGMDARLSKFEPAKVQIDGREFTVDPAEKREFEAALAIFRQGNFAASQQAFADFIRRYAQSGYVPSALFWLGNAQYATRDYKTAIQNFRILLTNVPDHLRAPEAVLSIANCQMELKDIKGARKTLEDLLKAYPQSEAATTAKDRLTKLR